MMDDNKLKALAMLCIVAAVGFIAIAAALDTQSQQSHSERMAIIERLSPEEARERLDQMEGK